MMDTTIPTRLVGPIKIIHEGVERQLRVPLATFETPLWFSVNRGARVARQSGGIQVTTIQESMSRSVIFETVSASIAHKIICGLPDARPEMEEVVATTSRFTKLLDWHTQIVGNLIYLRFSFSTGAAAGHNMATKAAEALQHWLLNKYSQLNYVSISGNCCVDKKNSAINGILGRGKYVIAEMNITRTHCEQLLHTSPEKLVNLNIKKNLIGSILSGSVRTANAHFANMLLAFYLATGQDAANIVEGSQGLTHAEVKEDQLYFSVTLPNLILGAVSRAQNIVPSIQNNLSLIDFPLEADVEDRARYLAVLAAAVVCCGELSLLAAQTIPGELMRSHLAIERSTHRK